MDNRGKKKVPSIPSPSDAGGKEAPGIKAASRVDMFFIFFKGCRPDVIFEGDCVANRFCPITGENLIF